MKNEMEDKITEVVIEQMENLIFWMDDLLKLAREVQRDLMRFYIPEKGWPSHIQALISPTDYDTVLINAKGVLERLKEDANNN